MQDRKGSSRRRTYRNNDKKKNKGEEQVAVNGCKFSHEGIGSEIHQCAWLAL
jgi:hypothetical protein